MLNQVVTYALREFPDLEPGFGPARVKWRISIASDSATSIEPFGGENGATLHKCPEYPDNLLQGGGKSNFLVDTLQVMLLHSDKKDASGKYAAKHDYFITLLKDASQEIPELRPAFHFFSDSDKIALAKTRVAELGAKSNDKAFFLVGPFNPLEDERCRNWWRTFRKHLLTESVKKPKWMVCLLSGDIVIPAQTHPKISGLKNVGGRGQDIVVGYDKKAFESFRLEQSGNGAMSETMANAYAKGLDDLIAKHSRTLAGAKVVYWFKERIPPEHDPLSFLFGFETSEQTEATALASVRRLLDSIRSGQRADLGDNRYYALTLSGAAGRVMARDWMEGRFEDLAKHIEAWFSDLAIVARDGKGQAPGPKFMAVCGALVRDLKDLPAPTATTLWRVAVEQRLIPQPLMAQALARFRAELVDKDQPSFNHARIALIKAYFVRKFEGGDSIMTAYLNPDHPEPAYHCGRLLAVLANLQRAALGNVGAGVVQRYYAAASQTPGLILGRLVGNARNHLSKLDTRLAWWYDERIADVMSHLQDRVPRILDLEGQGLFALGYYQQLAALRAGNKSTESATDSAQGEIK